MCASQLARINRIDLQKYFAVHCINNHHVVLKVASCSTKISTQEEFPNVQAVCKAVHVQAFVSSEDSCTRCYSVVIVPWKSHLQGRPDPGNR